MDKFLHCLLLGVSLLLDKLRLKFLFDVFVSLDVPFTFTHHEVFCRPFSRAGSDFDVVVINDVLFFKIKSHGSVIDVDLEKIPGIHGDKLHWGRGSPIYLGHMVTICGIL